MSVKQAKCSKCSSINPHGSQFCYRCGAPLLQVDENVNLSSICLERVIDDRSVENIVRANIAEWANSIPHHGIEDFSNKITIDRIVETPYYSIVLQVEYESREWCYGVCKPSDHKDKTRSIVEAQPINAWRADIPSPSGFETVDKIFNLPGYYHIVACPNCEGSGTIECIKCHGEGKLECSSCDGTGEQRCWNCSGRGEVTCGNCDGSGKDFSGRRCTSCQGRGHRPCTNCRQGFHACQTCKGKRDVTCNNCNGRRKLVCDVCNGEKSMVKYSFLHLKGTPKTFKDFLCHKSIPTDLVNKINNIEGINIVRFQEKELNNYCSDNSQCAEISEKILSLIHQAINERDNNQKNQGNMPREVNGHFCVGTEGLEVRIAQDVIAISVIYVKRIEYRFDGESYSLWLYNNNRVYATESPISEKEEQILAEAQSLYQSKKYTAAYDELVRVLEMNSSNTIAQGLLRKYRFFAWCQKNKKMLIISMLIGVILLTCLSLAYRDPSKDKLLNSASNSSISLSGKLVGESPLPIYDLEQSKKTILSIIEKLNDAEIGEYPGANPNIAMEEFSVYYIALNQRDLVKNRRVQLSDVQRIAKEYFGREISQPVSTKRLKFDGDGFTLNPSGKEWIDQYNIQGIKPLSNEEYQVLAIVAEKATKFNNFKLPTAYLQIEAKFSRRMIDGKERFIVLEYRTKRIDDKGTNPITGYKRYKNDRYGFSIDFPENFVANKPPVNGDGLSFTSPDSRTVLSLSGGNNSGIKLKEYLQIASRGKNVNSVSGDDWFVVNWKENGNITYCKMFVGSSSHNSFTITYPEDQKKAYDAIVSNLESTFKPGDINRSW